MRGMNHCSRISQSVVSAEYLPCLVKSGSWVNKRSTNLYKSESKLHNTEKATRPYQREPEISHTYIYMFTRHVVGWLRTACTMTVWAGMMAEILRSAGSLCQKSLQNGMVRKYQVKKERILEKHWSRSICKVKNGLLGPESASSTDCLFTTFSFSFTTNSFTTFKVLQASRLSSNLRTFWLSHQITCPFMA